MCGCVGLAVIVRFIVKTIRWGVFCHFLRQRPPAALVWLGDPTGTEAAVNVKSVPPLFTLRLPSLDRFFTLLRRESVVVNRWFTWSHYWQGCSALHWQCDFLLLVQISFSADLWSINVTNKRLWKKTGNNTETLFVVHSVPEIKDQLINLVKVILFYHWSLSLFISSDNKLV